jgi:hypothetical protein
VVDGVKTRILNGVELLNVALTGNPVNPECKMTEVFTKSLNDMEEIKMAEEVVEKKKLGIIDKLLEKAISRKLLVFLSATGLMVWSTLDPETWGMIAMVYIGGQTVVDFAKMWRHGT